MADLAPEQAQFYASMEQTFMSPGWALMTQGWKEEQEQLPQNVFFNAQSMEDVRAARVRYGLLHELITLPETIAQQKLNVIEDEPSE